jgi:hypothetical protein
MIYPINTTLTLSQVENIYCSLLFSGEQTRPGAVKISEKKWQPAAVELVLVRGYVRGYKQATILEAKTYTTLKAANRAAAAKFR